MNLPTATVIELGDDADRLPRKNCLNPEYFYIGELVSILDAEKEIVGIILSSKGDLSRNEGKMVVRIGNMIQVKVPYADVSVKISKLIGNFALSSDTLSMASPRREPEIKRDDVLQKKLQSLACLSDDVTVTTELLHLLQNMNETFASDFYDFLPECPIMDDDELTILLFQTSPLKELIDDELVQELAKLFLVVCLPESKNKKNHIKQVSASAKQCIVDQDLIQFVSNFANWISSILTHLNYGNQLPRYMDTDSNPALPYMWPSQKSLVADSTAGTIRNSEPHLAKDVAKLDAFDKNALQVTRISTPFTIWHAVGSFGIPDGRACWLVVRMVLKFLRFHHLECPWMRGSERGVFGETPLHIALLFNKADDEDVRFHKMFRDLWDICPTIHGAQYKDPLYAGENILHLAIIRNFGKRVIDHILASQQRDELLKHRAVGTFFKESTLSYGYCNLLGELPLFFAACSHQIGVFKNLVNHGADLEATATDKRHNLLHLLILADSSMSKRSELADQGPALLKRYRALVRVVSRRDSELLARLESQRNADSCTPLMLAAAEGSVDMFVHLFDCRKIETAWTYGALTCKKLYLDGVDVPFPQADGTARASAGSTGAASDSILEMLVVMKRKDILSRSQIDRLVETKWDKYGRSVFHRKLGATLFVTASVFLLPMTQLTPSLGWRLSHSLSHTLVAFVAEYLCEGSNNSSLLHRFIFRTWGKGELTYAAVLSQLITDVWQWLCCESLAPTAAYKLVVAAASAFSLRSHTPLAGGEGQGLENEQHCRPGRDEGDAGHLIRTGSLQQSCLSLRLSLESVCDMALSAGTFASSSVGRCLSRLLNWDAEQGFTDLVPIITRLLLLKFLFHVWVSPRLPPTCPAEPGSQASWLDAVEAALYSALGCLSFAKVASLAMVSKACGTFVLMVCKVVACDLPVFVAIYSIVLLVFAHSHFLASNHLHAGVGEGMDSMWRIFSAMLGSFGEESNEVSRHSLSLMLVTGISVINYFLVAVVLLNLLIAMLSSTYEANSKDAQQSWNLHRASLLIRIDRSMSRKQREQPDKVFWQTAAVTSQRFVTFNIVDHSAKDEEEEDYPGEDNDEALCIPQTPPVRASCP